MKHIFTLLAAFSLSFFAIQGLSPIRGEERNVSSAEDGRRLLVRSSVKTDHSVRESESSSLIQSGSGTVIKKEKDRFYVLSCAHIAEYKGKINPGKLTVTTWDGEVHKAKVTYYDRQRDMSLILVKAESPVMAAAIAEDEKYKAGTVYTKVGYPGGGELKIASGKCADWYTRSSENEEIVYTVAAIKSTSGDSGGGLFRDCTLVGVVWGGIDQHLRATRVKDIKIFLKDAEFKN